jgi:hypothetical protein
LFATEAVDQNIGLFTSGECGAKLFTICGIGSEDAIRFVREATGGFFRGDEGGDVPTGLAKKIRASFTGVTATGEEDARS